MYGPVNPRILNFIEIVGPVSEIWNKYNTRIACLKILDFLLASFLKQV